jgi:hypothetical protein
MSEQTAKKLFYEKSYVAALELFLGLEMSYEAGFCALLSNKPEQAREIWQSAKTPSAATKWGLIVCDLIRLKCLEQPTYFQVRAFLEVYLNLLIENELFKYAENLICAQDILARSNSETYKFIARVLLAHGYMELLPRFIERSKQCCYRDPEIHFIEAQMHLQNKNPQNALKSTNEVLSIIPEYFPAQELKKSILGTQF